MHHPPPPPPGFLKNLSIQIHSLLGVRPTKRLKYSRGSLLHPASLSESSLLCVSRNCEGDRAGPQITWSGTVNLHLGARRRGLNLESVTRQPVSGTLNRFFLLWALAWVPPWERRGWGPCILFIHLTAVPAQVCNDAAANKIRVSAAAEHTQMGRLTKTK